MRIAVTLNGTAHDGEVEPRTLLSDFIRHDAGLTGTKVGCEHGVCGACTVQLDGEPIRSCLTLAVQADGCDVRTIEGLAPGPLQAAFHEHHALQCGFCTAGIPDDARRVPARAPAAHRGRGQGSAHRQPLPLHGLPPDRQGRAQSL